MPKVKHEVAIRELFRVDLRIKLHNEKGATDIINTINM